MRFWSSVPRAVAEAVWNTRTVPHVKLQPPSPCRLTPKLKGVVAGRGIYVPPNCPARLRQREIVDRQSNATSALRHPLRRKSLEQYLDAASKRTCCGPALADTPRALPEPR